MQGRFAFVSINLVGTQPKLERGLIYHMHESTWLRLRITECLRKENVLFKQIPDYDWFTRFSNQAQE